MKEKKPFFKQKSTWAGITGLVGVIAAYFTGDLGLSAAISAAVPCVFGIFFPEKKKVKVGAGA